MDEHKKNTWLPIAGGLALIIVLFILVKFIFAGLERVVPPERLNPDHFAASTGEGTPAPAFCPHCGEEMTPSFRWGQFCPFCGEKVE